MPTSTDPAANSGRKEAVVPDRLRALVGAGGLGDRLLRALSVLRRIIGAPDYDLYLRHHATCHPGTRPLSREAFTRQRLDARYSTPGNRCC